MLILIAAAALLMPLARRTYLVVSNDETGAVYARYPLRDGEEFSIEFIHSVNKSPVCDYYTVKDGKIYVTRTHYYAFGAGVQTYVEEGQTLSYTEDGGMTVSGFDREIPELRYIVGTVSDHVLTVGEKSVSLRRLCGKNTHVRFYCQTGFDRFFTEF